MTRSRTAPASARSRPPEYSDPLALEPSVHTAMAAMLFKGEDPDAGPNPRRRRFNISHHGWALADFEPEATDPIRLVVYPINLSLSGVGIIVPRHVEPGMVALVHLAPAGRTPILLGGTVARCNEWTPTAWVAGIKLSPESAAALARHLSASDAAAVAPRQPNPAAPAAAAPAAPASPEAPLLAPPLPRVPVERDLLGETRAVLSALGDLAKRADEIQSMLRQVLLDCGDDRAGAGPSGST